MRPTVRLGQFFGVDVGLHWTIVLITMLLTTTLSGTVLPEFAPGHSTAAYLATALVAAVLFMASIVAHELGHSLVAIRGGIKVRGITLFALGGVASLECEPASPGLAARVALAGPAVSIGVGVASLGAAIGANAPGLPGLVVAALVWLGVINLSLAVFNLLPALPLDGGRVLQAYLWRRRGDRHEATISAAKAGRWIGWGLVAFGFWELTQGGNGLWTMLIGWFVLTTAKAEGLRARMERDQARMPAAGRPFGFGPFGPPPPAGHPFGVGGPGGSGPWGPPPTSPPYSGAPGGGTGAGGGTAGAGGPAWSGAVWGGTMSGPFIIASWPPPRAEDRRAGAGPGAPMSGPFNDVIDVTGEPVEPVAPAQRR
ncbi:MAG: site-2 protease family protein [Acidimicrobiia bacterium]|nr:site-2 protease family protein [Acidimicrobiia bacterium]